VGCPHAYLQRQPQRPPPPLIPAYRLRRGGRVSGGSCRQRAPGRHHVEESRLGKVGVTHTPPAASHGTDSINTKVPQRKRATSTTWDGTVGAGCRARPVQGRRVLSRPRRVPTPTVSQQFAPDFGNSSPNVQNRAVKTRKVDLFRPNTRCTANRVGRRASTLCHIYFISIKDGERVGGYPCGQASSRTSAEKAHSLHLYQ
jgi:hypothetical protein